MVDKSSEENKVAPGISTDDTNRDISAIFDIDDVDRIISNFTLAEIDRALMGSEAVMGEIPEEDGRMRDYWNWRISIFKAAQETAEWCIKNDIPTIKPTFREKPKDFRLLDVIQTMRKLEEQLGDMKEQFRLLLKHHSLPDKKRITNSNIDIDMGEGEKDLSAGTGAPATK